MTIDLRTGPPRRWNAELGGVRWLPRLIDKARAVSAGTLGTYFYGQSPVDSDFLRALGLGYAGFAQIVAGAPDDGAVVVALEVRDADALQRARAWGRRDLVWKFGLELPFLDIDDGYLRTPPFLATIVRRSANAISAAAKRHWPSKYE